MNYKRYETLNLSIECHNLIITAYGAESHWENFNFKTTSRFNSI